ncbi:PepSY domain-containing protein [Microvirga massiliensis]|uniref:PepSY domain-containing protein n=1 Tax=Microvirga massiliensis TaxID=1033741 RepID=UPI00069A7C88|nr:PepSY domain-containing protein [Microvirga massiliensis]
MLNHVILTGTALALTTALAMAQATSAPPASGATTPAPAGSTVDQRANRGSSEFQAIQSVKVPLSQAIATAEQQGQGRAISAEFEEQDRNDPAHYEIKVVQSDGKLVEHKVDANSGTVIKSENQPFERYFTRLKPADFQNARTSLKDAITMAEQRIAGGKAVEAEVGRENDAIVYEIEVATAERSQEIKIDANGQVVSRD